MIAAAIIMILLPAYARKIPARSTLACQLRAATLFLPCQPLQSPVAARFYGGDAKILATFVSADGLPPPMR